jgi:hypothetical protein
MSDLSTILFFSQTERRRQILRNNAPSDRSHIHVGQFEIVRANGYHGADVKECRRLDSGARICVDLQKAVKDANESVVADVTDGSIDDDKSAARSLLAGLPPLDELSFSLLLSPSQTRVALWLRKKGPALINAAIPKSWRIPLAQRTLLHLYQQLSPDPERMEAQANGHLAVRTGSR